MAPGDGIIPARAGFTARSGRRCRAGSDHPRSRGVYRRQAEEAAGTIGSSPLARGLLVGGAADVEQVGIIPARAGFTRSAASQSSRTRDHPRSRGVYDLAHPDLTGAAGSSPLARGLPVGEGKRVQAGRIIPARAGFTCCADHWRARDWDHPRSRGVYSSAMPREAVTVGSSPLARGLPDGPDRRARRLRIIPARAGFTRSSRTSTCGRSDHPRSRGVYCMARGVPHALAADHPRSRGVYHLVAPSVSVRNGSSPLARGLRGPAAPRLAAPGIIPARAGFTRSSRTSTCGRSDHPRSRGVYCMARGVPHALAADHPRSRGVYHLVAPSVSVRNGSSPLARGLRGPAAPRLAAPGIIPARAGFTT